MPAAQLESNPPPPTWDTSRQGLMPIIDVCVSSSPWWTYHPVQIKEKSIMKTLFTTAFLAFAFIAGTALSAADAAPKPFPASLKTCVVSDEKLGGEMGKPYVFVHEGQEVKLCC